MKKLIYIFIIIIIISCNNNETKSISTESIDFEEATIDEEYAIPETYAVSKTTRFEHQKLSIEKLQEFYDLLVLKQKHPEFNEDISIQLKKYTDETLLNFKKKEAIIKNVKLLENPIQVSDSTQRIKLGFDLVSNELITKDTIWATIFTKNIIVEGNTKKSIKIKFSRH
ncbi:hypothetical protein [Hanstruepera marina]|uniref:hypothetical protein n=1 Tax=Hanstruepera marina TaxID=2873265 RepID=UPI001CA764CE|nr:hypothetical protein [Hanstruepera marina]